MVFAARQVRAAASADAGQSTNSDCVSMKSQSASLSTPDTSSGWGPPASAIPCSTVSGNSVPREVLPQPLLARQIQIQPPHEDFHGGHPFLRSSTLGPAPEVFKCRTGSGGLQGREHVRGPLQRAGDQRVVGPGAPLFAVQQSGVDEDFEVMGHRGLAEVQRFGEVGASPEFRGRVSSLSSG